MAKESRLCYKCLDGEHRKQSCQRPPCRTCKRWHHHSLHNEKPETEPAENREIANNVRLPINCTQISRAYLKMVPVEVYGPSGSTTVLALLDEGSTVTLLDSSVAKQIGLKGPKETLRLETVGGKTLTKKDSMKLNIRVRGLHQRQKRMIFGARTMDDMSLAPQRLKRETIEGYAHLKSLADQLCYDEQSPKLLIGQDNWGLIAARRTRRGRRNQPVASFTQLGWVLHGLDNSNAKEVNFLTCAHVSMREEALDRQVKEHFTIESHLNVRAQIWRRRRSTSWRRRTTEVGDAMTAASKLGPTIPVRSVVAVPEKARRGCRGHQGEVPADKDQGRGPRQPKIPL